MTRVGKKKRENPPVISAYAYTVNNLGQRTSFTTSGEVYATAPADRVWQYDSLGQVVTANDNHYTYDQIGNRITTQKETEQSRIYTANALNQYATIGNITPTYDADGNQLTGLQATNAQPERNQQSFVYNAQNRPIQVRQNDTVLENYTYDHQGRRILKGDTLTLYDGYNAIAEYNLNTRTLKTAYVWGNDLSGTLQGAGGVNGLLSVKDYTTQTPLIAYPAYDGNGNISEYLTEENSGSVTAHYEYDAFGNIAKKTGEKEYGYQFCTKPYDNLTGLNYYNYRDYDPVNGRWINRDLIEEMGSINLYAYIMNCLIDDVDILGLSKGCNISIVGKKEPINKSKNYSYGKFFEREGYFLGTSGKWNLNISIVSGDSSVSGTSSISGTHGEWYWLNTKDYSATATAEGIVSCDCEGGKCKARVLGVPSEEMDSNDYVTASVKVTGSASDSSAALTVEAISKFSISATTSMSVKGGKGVEGGVSITGAGNQAQLKIVKTYNYKCEKSD